MISILAVAPDKARQVGTFLKHLIEQACSRGSDKTPDQLIQDCARPMGDDGRAILWVVSDDATPVGVCITRNITADGELAVLVHVLGGEGGAKWAGEVRKRLHEFRKAEGAACLRCEGRKGWGRALGLAPTGLRTNTGWIFKDYG